MTIHSCPFCGSITSIHAVLAGHTRQECEARILDRIAHIQQRMNLEVESLAALHAAANRDQGVSS